MNSDPIIKIKYEAHDRWYDDDDNVDCELQLLCDTLNLSIPQNQYLIRRIINDRLHTINNQIGDIAETLHALEIEKQDAEDECDRLDNMLTELKGDVRKLINSIDSHIFERLLDAAASARHNRQRSITITGEEAEIIADVLAAVQKLPTA